jgi:hypothetical protein
MRHFLTILIIIFTTSGLFATGLGNPNLHLTDDTAYLTGNAAQDLISNVNHITYTGTDSIELKWEVIEFNAPSAWIMGFCDKTSCYTLNESTTQTFWIKSGASGLMDLQVSPISTPGTGKVRIAIYPVGGTINDGIVLTHLITVNPVSVNRNQNVNFSMFPNPVKDYLNISFSRKGDQHIEIYNILGNKVLVKDIENADFARISFTNFQRGRYIVMYRSENGKVITKSISKE